MKRLILLLLIFSVGRIYAQETPFAVAWHDGSAKRFSLRRVGSKALPCILKTKEYVFFFM